ncbi:VOC family protein [Actinomadura adrarensis]|uniref:VOC family protein n=1 Tax=Actinomadura adrarensis TaxID=1819600 RepID=A0ABW3CHE5_9ACTN
MTEGVKTILYPVRDLEKSKALFTRLIGAEPTADSPYYAGFDVDGQQIGLVPGGHDQGMEGPVPHFHVSDIEGTLQALLDAGAAEQQKITEVSKGRRIAKVKDLDGNIIALLQDD